MFMSQDRSTADPALSFPSLLAGLEAAGEETRLRILCLIAVSYTHLTLPTILRV